VDDNTKIYATIMPSGYDKLESASEEDVNTGEP
jgi:hypothetical protein